MQDNIIKMLFLLLGIFVILRLLHFFWMCMLGLTFPRVESAQARDVREECVTLKWTEGHVLCICSVNSASGSLHLQGAPLGQEKQQRGGGG